jgi:hypothetical protein
MKRKEISGLILIALVVLVLSSCSNQGAEEPAPATVPDTSADTTLVEEATSTPDLATVTPLAEPIYGQAVVESVEVLTTDSDPVQIVVLLEGTLPDDCAVIDEIAVQREGDVVNLSVITVTDPGQSCSETAVPFEEAVPLDASGLEAGTYTISVNGLQDSFTLGADEPAPDEAAASPSETATASLSGRVWHDLCTLPVGEDAELGSGCVLGGDGTVQADGLMENEPGIEGVLVSLGEGACPAESVVLAVTDADGGYRFDTLALGTYCVSVNTEVEQNREILLPGTWTAPDTGVAEATVALDEEDALQTADFGWDYEFLPAPEVDLSSCTNSFEFVQDLNIPDDTNLPPGAEFTKRWQLRNNGTCPWSTEYSVVFVGGDQMSAAESLPIGEAVAVGQTLEVSVDMIAPQELGTYRGNWQIAAADGEPFGIDGFIEDAFWLRIVVAEDAAPPAEALPNSGTIGGVVWDDFCINSDPGRGCTEFPEDSGLFIADGSFGAGEAPLSEITISLAGGACPADGSLPADGALISTTLSDAAGLYRFENLSDGTYCIFMDALSEDNVDLLIPGNWTWPATGVGRYSFILDPGEQALDLDFGWDYVD